MIDFYNQTKCGTDVFDQLCGNYTCARACYRWPMRLFFGMLDQAGVNSCILYNCRPSGETQSRREFLKDLVFALIQPHLEEREQTPGLQRNLLSNIRDILSADVIGNNSVAFDTGKMNKRKRCHYSPYETHRKTFYCCTKCNKATCDEHRTTICKECFC